jgi:RNA polymerase sigma-70 factor (ECF subfamily)
MTPALFLFFLILPLVIFLSNDPENSKDSPLSDVQQIRESEMGNANDEELALEAARGDPEAFARLLESHYEIIYRLAYRFLGAREEAEDVAQEVCMKLARVIKGFEGRSSFRTWLYRITVNAVRDFQRKGASRHTHEERYVQEKAIEDRASADNPISVSELYSLVNTLPEKLKSTLLLVSAEGLSHKEAALVLGCAETTVSWRVFQARKKLRPLLMKALKEV